MEFVDIELRGVNASIEAATGIADEDVHAPPSLIDLADGRLDGLGIPDIRLDADTVHSAASDLVGRRRSCHLALFGGELRVRLQVLVDDRHLRPESGKPKRVGPSQGRAPPPVTIAT